jgi:DNA adenine methylase
MSNLKTYTPLRYPGGKNVLTSYVKKLLIANNLIGCTYIEPYAGGAAVALNLLLNGYVTNIIINDLDRSIYAFWYSVLNYTDKLCDMINNSQMNIDEWYNQKNIQLNKQTEDLLKLGFSTLYLNFANSNTLYFPPLKFIALSEFDIISLFTLAIISRP